MKPSPAASVLLISGAASSSGDGRAADHLLSTTYILTTIMTSFTSSSNVRIVGSCVLCALLGALVVANRGATLRSTPAETGAHVRVGLRHAASAIYLPGAWIRPGSPGGNSTDEQKIGDLTVASIGQAAERIARTPLRDESPRSSFQVDPVSLFCRFCVYRL